VETPERVLPSSEVAFKYGAWIGLAAGILLIVVAALQRSVARRQAP
jgi:hypothetical protein